MKNWYTFSFILKYYIVNLKSVICNVFDILNISFFNKIDYASLWRKTSIASRLNFIRFFFYRAQLHWSETNSRSEFINAVSSMNWECTGTKTLSAIDNFFSHDYCSCFATGERFGLAASLQCQRKRPFHRDISNIISFYRWVFFGTLTPRFLELVIFYRYASHGTVDLATIAVLVSLNIQPNSPELRRSSLSCRWIWVTIERCITRSIARLVCQRSLPRYQRKRLTSTLFSLHNLEWNSSEIDFSVAATRWRDVRLWRWLRKLVHRGRMARGS